MSVVEYCGTGSAGDWTDEWPTEIVKQSARATALAERISVLTVDADTADGAVEVTVDSRGAILDLRLDDRVLRWSADDIAREVLESIRRGNDLMTTRVAQVVREVVG